MTRSSRIKTPFALALASAALVAAASAAFAASAENNPLLPHASVTPEAFLFAADGRLAYRGTIDDNRADPDKVTAHYLGDALAAVAAGHSPKTAETKSLGCGIKFRAETGKP